MNVRILQFCLVYFLFFNVATASFAAHPSHPNIDTSYHLRKVYLGGGLGINYGGYGVQANYLPISNIRLSAGYGTNLIDMNYNFGINFRFLPTRRLCPIFSYMLGYNGGIEYKDKPELSQSFKGSALGAGIEIWNKRKVNFFQFQLVLPIRSIEFENKIEEINSSPFFKLTNLNTILLSIGYHFGIRGNK